MVIVKMFGEPTHSMTLAGYCTNTFIDFNNDGFITDTIDINYDGVVDLHDNETVLWIVINSWGDNWRKSHFLYKYDMLTRVWNDQVFIPIPDTAYTPELTFKIRLKHPNRKDIKISAGISSDLLSKYPEQLIDFPIWNYQGGAHGMTGIDTLPDSDILEFGIDITDIKKLKYGSGPFNIFIKLENTGIQEGELQYFSIIDYSETRPAEYIIIDNPVEISSITDNLFYETLRLKTIKSDSIINIASSTYISAYPNELIVSNIYPVDGQEPYQFYIIQNNEYSVNLTYRDFSSCIYSINFTNPISTFNPAIINPNWDILFNGKSYDYITFDQSGTITIDTTIKFRSKYPYQSLKKKNNSQQINPYNITEYSRTITSASFRIKDTAILILKKDCVYDEAWDDYFCNYDYFEKITPEGIIEITYCDEIPQKEIFANIKTPTNTYYIPYEKALADTFNTVRFTPNHVDNLFAIDENGALSMRPVSEPGKYETYVLVRDANGQEFTKRIEVNVINEIFIGNLYPNPAKEIIYCDIYNPTEQNTTIEIFTITGQMVYKETTLLPAGINEYNFNTTQFGQGVYLLKISFKNQSQTQRFVVTK